MFAPQTSDLLEKLALIFLYNFYREHSLLKLKNKKLSPKINVKNIKHRIFLFIYFLVRDHLDIMYRVLMHYIS